MEDLLRVGVITQTHGLKGEVKVFPTTDDPKRFKDLGDVVVDNGKEKINLTVEGVRFFKNLVIVKFKDIDDINDVEKYKKAEIYVTRENAVPLEEGEYYIADLIGLKVADEEGRMLGSCRNIFPTGANLVMEVEGEKDFMVPYVKPFIVNVDLEKGIITIHVIEGLI